MKSYQQHFIQTAQRCGALNFGEFTLKSGRKSPYFFNAGLFYQGASLSVMAKCYAQAIVDAKIDYDVIFGPAYKGISIAALTCAALFDQHQVQSVYAYNRKEAKNYGEGGQVVGAAINDKKLLILDDVVTAGTAIKEVSDLAQQHNATVAGVMVGLDRQEKGASSLSALQEVERNFAIPAKSIIKLDDIMTFLQDNQEQDKLAKINKYRSEYGI